MLRRDGGYKNIDVAERKEVLARTSPERDRVSVISYNSYDPRISPSKSSISSWLRSWKGSNGASEGEKEEDGTFEP